MARPGFPAPRGALMVPNSGQFRRPPGFDPVTDLDWVHVYWAEGPRFEALGLADGAAVTSWPDEVGTDDLAQVTGTASFRVSGINSLPAVQGDDSTSHLEVAFGSAITPGLSIVAVFQNTTEITTDNTIFDNSSGTARSLIAHQATPDTWRMSGTVDLDHTDSTDTNPHLAACVFGGALSAFYIDGTTVSGDTGTTADLLGLSVLANRAGNQASDAHLAFVGVYDGNVADDTNWNAFTTWAGRYNISIS